MPSAPKGSPYFPLITLIFSLIFVVLAGVLNVVVMGEMKLLRADMAEQIVALNGDLSGEVRNLKSEVERLKNDVKEENLNLKSNVEQKIGGMRNEVNGKIRGYHNSTRSQIDGLKTDVVKLEEGVVQTLGTISLANMMAPMAPTSILPIDGSNTVEEPAGLSVDQIASLEIRSKRDIAPYLDRFAKSRSAQELGYGMQRVRRWTFAPHEVEEANILIETYSPRLRDWITREVKKLDQDALAAATGEEAMKLFWKGTALMDLFPEPYLDEAIDQHREALQARTETHERLSELQRLKHNEWAIAQMEQAFAKTTKVLESEDESNKAALIAQIVGKSIELIDPALLDLAGSELYERLLRSTHEALSEQQQIALAKRLNSSDLAKKSLKDF